MIDFANLAAEERELYFQQTAERTGLPAHLVEKDFWVCFTLQQLFSAPALSGYLTFKGGTSLSKVFKAIDRFSEDIDFAVSRERLGFSDEAAPDIEGISMEERKRRLTRLAVTCLAWITDELYPLLKIQFSSTLKSAGWNMELIDDQNGNQQILFYYPQTKVTRGSSYNPPRVRLELTARTDNHPSMNAVVRSFVAEQFPEALSNPNAQVDVLRVERTFWEKATILHQFHFQEDPSRVSAGFSRHYYDVFQLTERGFATQSLKLANLLQDVADHKNVFYRQQWARYDLARSPKTLELLPNSAIQNAIATDYSDMQEMIFGSPPSFTEILEKLRELKTQVNALS